MSRIHAEKPKVHERNEHNPLTFKNRLPEVAVAKSSLKWTRSSQYSKETKRPQTLTRFILPTKKYKRTADKIN